MMGVLPGYGGIALTGVTEPWATNANAPIAMIGAFAVIRKTATRAATTGCSS